MILSASGFAVAYAAVAASTLAAVRAHARAIVNEVATIFATRFLFFLFFHPIRLCHILLADACELSFRNQTLRYISREEQTIRDAKLKCSTVKHGVYTEVPSIYKGVIVSVSAIVLKSSSVISEKTAVQASLFTSISFY
jgi:hypothetical protein